MEKCFMKLKSIILLTALVLITDIAFAAGMATVDYSLLMAFHPKMSRFDFTVGRFYLPGLNLSNEKQMTDIRKKIRQKNSESAPKIAQLDRDRMRNLKEIANFDESARTTLNAMLRDGKDISAIERSYSQKKIQLQVKQTDLDEQLLALQEAGLDFIYYSREKTKGMIVEIMTEIDRILEQISRERGNLAIIDRSYLSPPASVRPPPVPAEGMDMLSADLYGQLLKSDFAMNPGWKEGPPGHAERVMEGTETAFKKEFEKYLSQAPTLGRFISNFRGRLFLAGGEDLTPLALSRILDSNPIAPEIKQRLIHLISQVQ